ncbi:MAG: superoxide dismutase family protein [Caulobacteraceae bacterium]
MTSKLKLAAAAAILALSGGGAVLAADTAVAMKSGEGADLGQVQLTDGPSGVLLHFDLRGVKPGWHAVHFHEKADCSDPKFTTAGAHINHATEKKPHGLLNPGGPDMGDLANIYAAADGTVHADVFSALVSMKGMGGRPALQDADGSAIVMHENPDDYTTQPIGGAGGRAACGVVK